MSENKTVNDAPQMARKIRRTIISDEMIVGAYTDALDTIAALPPAPLPADVAAELAAFRALAKVAYDALSAPVGAERPSATFAREILESSGLLPWVLGLMDIRVALAALHKPAPMTEDVAEKVDELKAVLSRLVNQYLANAGSAHQFVSCVTPDGNMRMWDDAYVLLGGTLSPDRKIGRYYEDSREYRLAELHKPAMTEAEQQKEATDGRR